MRFVDITIGFAAAILVGSVIWPNHARVRYFREFHRYLNERQSIVIADFCSAGTGLIESRSSYESVVEMGSSCWTLIQGSATTCGRH